MIPQIENSLENEIIEIKKYPSLTYKLGEYQIAGKVDGIEAIKQAIYHILMVERYSNPIYDDNYGVELEKYIGQDFSFLESTIEDTLREALTQDDRIEDISVTEINQVYQEMRMANTKRAFSFLVTDKDENIVTENDDYLIAKNIDGEIKGSVGKTLVTHIKFDVFCNVGDFSMEVGINV